MCLWTARHRLLHWVRSLCHLLPPRPDGLSSHRSLHRETPRAEQERLHHHRLPAKIPGGVQRAVPCRNANPHHEPRMNNNKPAVSPQLPLDVIPDLCGSYEQNPLAVECVGLTANQIEAETTKQHDAPTVMRVPTAVSVPNNKLNHT